MKSSTRRAICCPSRERPGTDGQGQLAGDEQGTYLSIKLPALRFSTDLLNEVCARAQSVARRIHFDSLEAETADGTRSMVEDALAMHPGVEIGYTLPGRWRRSLDDAGWVSERGLPVRVVKGEWPDPDDPQRDLRAGYLEVINELAGRARHVSVATHDPLLAAEAVGRLRAAGTPCDLELLYGLPVRASIRQARELGLDIRIYVPYGEAYMPYALSQVRRKNPPNSAPACANPFLFREKGLFCQQPPGRFRLSVKTAVTIHAQT